MRLFPHIPSSVSALELSFPDLDVAALSLSDFYFWIIGCLEFFFFFFLFLFIQRVRDWLQD